MKRALIALALMFTGVWSDPTFAKEAAEPRSGTAHTLVREVPEAETATSAETLSDVWLPMLPADQQVLFGEPHCGVEVRKIEYATTGGAGEPTTASAALMIPTGSHRPCRGPMPMVLYAHGTAIERAEDLSAVNHPDNPAFAIARRIVLIFAAQGKIVVAPNYAGYDISPLAYTPYLNVNQQSREMADALAATREWLALHAPLVADNGKLFVTGYSQGGYVAMATLKALDAAGHPATAGAPLSGPYALAAMGDEIFLGHPNFGAPVYISMLANSYAHLPEKSLSIGTIFNPEYKDAPSLFPGNVSRAQYMTLVKAGKIPLSALFQSPPTAFPDLDSLDGHQLASLGFDPHHYLISTPFREAYVADVRAHPDGAAHGDGSSSALPHLAKNPQLPLRQQLEANDLRNYLPHEPLLLCGGNRDPEVYWNQGAGTMATLLEKRTLKHPGLQFAILDLDRRGQPHAFTSHGLSRKKDTIMRNQAITLRKNFDRHQYHNVLDKLFLLLALHDYHSAEEPYCLVAARTFFDLY